MVYTQSMFRNSVIIYLELKNSQSNLRIKFDY